MKDPMLEKHLNSSQCCKPKRAPYPRRRQGYSPVPLRQRRASLLFWLAMCCWGVAAVIVLALLKGMGLI